jgi:glycosyltransferase involved in cell wall biosynthesis
LEDDPRILKELSSLKKENYSFKFLSWNYGNIQLATTMRSAGKTINLTSGSIVSNIFAKNVFIRYFFLPIWWLFIFKNLLVEEWDLAHVINFHSIPPTIIAGKLKKKPVIYEIEDTWFDQINLPSFLRLFFISIDRLQMRLSAAVILIDEFQQYEFGSIPNKLTIPIYDSAIDIKNDAETVDHSIRKELVLFYAGEISKYRRLNLDKIFEAVKATSNTKIIFAGKGEVTILTEWAKKSPDKVKFLGNLPYLEVLKCSYHSDLLFVLRDSKLPIYKYICGSKIFEAMMCARPILVSKGTSTAIKVNQEKMGLVVDPNNFLEICKALSFFKENPDKCKIMGKNARKAYDKIYGWHIMGDRLITLYNQILS